MPLPPAPQATIEYPKHSAAYWAKAMAGQDFAGPDRIEPVTFNRALWRGLKGGHTTRSGYADEHRFDEETDKATARTKAAGETHQFDRSRAQEED